MGIIFIALSIIGSLLVNKINAYQGNVLKELEE